MKKALRMAHGSYWKQGEFEHNLELVAQNLDVIDEITLFTEPTHHGYQPDESVQETVSILHDRIRRYKELGVPRVGLNVLCTLGHTEDGAAIAPKADLQYMVNWDGVMSGSCLCPSDPRFTPYIIRRYKLYAGTGADFIWLDDDVRIHNHGVVRDYCFCDHCIRRYNERNGTFLSPEQVRSNFASDPAFRGSWHESASATLIGLFQSIREAIHSVDPKIDIGYMAGLKATVPAWIEASGAVLARPGGGFYNDLTPMEMFTKFSQMQRCIKRYPPAIRDIQYEYESYNFLSLQKSRHISRLETELMIAAGCTGILYNRWPHTADFLEMMAASAKKWDVFGDACAQSRAVGVYCDSEKAACALMEIGIPTTPYFESACAYFILGQEWDQFSDEQIAHMLCAGVYTDAQGHMNLAKRGIAELGGRIGQRYENGVWEHFMPHPINGDFESSERFVSLDIFHETDAYALLPEDGAETLSCLNSAFGGLRGCSAYFYRRKDGGAIAVDGCLMPRQLASENKKRQMANLFDLLSGNRVPVKIEKSAKIIPVVNVGGESISILLVNAHFDPTGPFTCRVRIGQNYVMLGLDGSEMPVPAHREGDELLLSVPSIAGWEDCILIGRA